MKPSLYIWLSVTLFDWALMVGSIVASGMWNNPLGYVLAAAIIGNRQQAIEVMGHDAAHFAACNNRKLNDFLCCALCWWPMWIGLKAYRKFHFAHHHHVGSDKDPELKYKLWQSPQWDLPVSLPRVIKLSIYDVLGYGFYTLATLVRLVPPKVKEWRDFIGPLLINVLATSILLLTGQGWVLLLWYGAMATFYGIFFRWRVWFEHQGTDGTLRYQPTWWQAMLFAPHNIGIHWEHHKYFGVPCYKLPALRKELAGPPIKTVREIFDFLAVAPATPSGNVVLMPKQLNDITF